MTRARPAATGSEPELPRARARPFARLPFFRRWQRRRVPVVLQQSETECAAACLAMILGYHGRATGLDECRELCGTGRDGASALALKEAASRQGLRARGYSSESSDLSGVDLPVVAHWKFRHFLVVERVGRDGVHVVDPAQGRRTLSPLEFEQGFTGVVLSFEPGPSFERRAREPRFSWGGYLRYVLRARGLSSALAQVLATSLVLQVLGLGLTLFTKVLVDEVLPFRVTELLPVLALGALIWVLAQAVATLLRSLLLIRLRARVDAQMMLGFFEHLLSLPYRFFQQRSSGDLVMRLGSNMVLREILTSHTISVVFDGLLVGTYLIVLIAWEPVFGLAVALLGLLQVALLLGTTRALHGLMQRDLQAQSESQGYLVEALAGIGTLKVSGAERHALEHWSGLFFKHLGISLRRSHVSAVVSTVMMGLQGLAPLFLLLLGTRLVLDGSMSLGSMLALNALAGSFFGPLGSLVASGQDLQLVGAHLDRIADVLGTQPESTGGGQRTLPQVKGRIELEGVSFRYDPQGPLVLQDISLSIEPGQKVALVGPTGSGKSTVAALLLGLYDVTQGTIRLDGHPIGELDRGWLRRQFGVVRQESFLFSGSIRGNISLDDPSIALEQVMDAARLAGVHEEIARLPLGYDTRLAEGGSGLSGGQRQRLSIARALVRMPAVLLLDEATSHLDVATEARVHANLDLFSCTRIVIAHRLSTIRSADRIVVLNDGRIVEQGSHAELMARDGAYRALVEGQDRAS